MKIGDLELETALPDDLDSKVRELTGYSAAAMHALLSEADVIAGTVARALHPFLVEEHDLAELATHIAEAGVTEVKYEVVKLYAEALDVLELDTPAEEAPDGEAEEQA